MNRRPEIPLLRFFSTSPDRLITQGEYVLFACLMAALIASLTCHEFGHAWVAKLFGDDTAEQAGRLSLNPLVHLDLMGLGWSSSWGLGMPSQSYEPP
ncbi:MAG: hypothetical protein CM1200mP9_03380 [Gammaproteobacteria bacterium]|nr:MAG: hypothetical protein CM1200mP9_03380 [Gammaproteobacteria bacterium]